MLAILESAPPAQRGTAVFILSRMRTLYHVNNESVRTGCRRLKFSARFEQFYTDVERPACLALWMR
jgi:hypothetical protein